MQPLVEDLIETLHRLGPGAGAAGLVLFLVVVAWVAGRLRRRNDARWARVAARYGLVAEPGLYASGQVMGRSVKVEGRWFRVRHKRRPSTRITVVLRSLIGAPAWAVDRARAAGFVLADGTLVRDFPAFLLDEATLDDALGLALTLAQGLDETFERGERQQT